VSQLHSLRSPSSPSALPIAAKPSASSASVAADQSPPANLTAARGCQVPGKCHNYVKELPRSSGGRPPKALNNSFGVVSWALRGCWRTDSASAGVPDMSNVHELCKTFRGAVDDGFPMVGEPQTLGLAILDEPIRVAPHLNHLPGETAVHRGAHSTRADSRDRSEWVGPHQLNAHARRK